MNISRTINNHKKLNSSRSHFTATFSRFFTSITCTAIISLTIFNILPCSAGDPFRSRNPRDISEQTELAFKALFEDGNYPLAREYLIIAERENPDFEDPMLPALRSALAYTEDDLPTMRDYAKKTITVAKAIADEDPLRSNLYLAVGNFLEGAYQFHTEGPVTALNKLQMVFEYFDKAEKIDIGDPELNLIKGYLNLFLAVNLPFSTPEQAIEKLQKSAYPQYLANRGIALAYRDLDDYDLALIFVEKAIESTPINPELYYLKGQILRKKGQQENNITLLQEAIKNFDLALVKIDQLPVEAVQKPLRREKRKTLEKIAELTTLPQEEQITDTPPENSNPRNTITESPQDLEDLYDLDDEENNSNPTDLLPPSRFNPPFTPTPETLPK